jgi:Phage integrase, N-terminal SAM-like domain
MSEKAKISPQRHQKPQPDGLTSTSGPKPKKLLDQVREALRTKHYSYRTEQTYIDWIKRYTLFHKKQHPKDLGVEEIREFIAHLATERKVATSTHTVLAIGARGIRRSVPSFSCIAPYCKKKST